MTDVCNASWSSFITMFLVLLYFVTPGGANFAAGIVHWGRTWVPQAGRGHPGFNAWIHPREVCFQTCLDWKLSDLRYLFGLLIYVITWFGIQIIIWWKEIINTLEWLSNQDCLNEYFFVIINNILPISLISLFCKLFSKWMLACS